MKRAILIVFLLVAASVLAPFTTASHSTIHDNAANDEYRRTLEDDGAVMRASGTPLDGYGNKVVYPGHEPGDGTLFLDSRLASRIGVDFMDEFPLLFSRTVTEPAFGRSDVLLPGYPHVAFAWYGQWNDIDQDGMIDDVHDADGAASDEFRWRGLASGEEVAMVQYLLPRTGNGGFSIMADPSKHDTDVFDDHTATEHAEQYWHGPVTYATDGSLLTGMQTLVVAGAQAVIGRSIAYDLDDPAALIDVDRYEALSPEFGALVSSAYTYAADAQDQAFATYQTFLNEVFFPTYGGAIGTTDWIVENATTTAENLPSINAYYAREPNQPLDDYENRAVYGGVGDRYGTGNHYPGYEHSYQFYADTFPFAQICVGAYARAPPTGIEASQWLTCNYSNRDPLGGLQETSGAPTFLGFKRLLGLWKDLNGDGHVGDVCDPATDDFDPVRNGCRNQGEYAHDPFPGAEFINHCNTVAGGRGSVRVQPLNGEWSGAVLFRDYRESTRVAFDPGHVRILAGQEPVDIRWKEDCDPYVRDIIMFPAGGSPVPLLTVSEYTIPGFNDETIGILIGQQSVRDVDIISATL